jgi:nucleotide-binding universal stress UspA family protein
MRQALTRILIAVDSRSLSDPAIEQGLALAVKDDAEVVFVQVVSAAGRQFGPKRQT